MAKCIKCSDQYTEAGDEDYLCPPCLEERKVLNAQLDARPRQPEPAWNRMSVDERFPPFQVPR